MRRTLIVLGLLIVVVGVLWPWLGRLSPGRLPGDLVVERPGLKIYVPVVTMILASVVLTLVLWLLRK